MAELARETIQEWQITISEALVGLMYGSVTIEVKGGRIDTIRRHEDTLVAQNGKALGDYAIAKQCPPTEPDGQPFSMDAIRQLVIGRRQALGWNQRELATRADLSHHSIFRFEGDRGNLAWDALSKVMAALDLRLTVR